MRGRHNRSESIVVGSKERNEVLDKSVFIFVAETGAPALHLVDFRPPLRLRQMLLQDHLGSVAREAVRLRYVSTLPPSRWGLIASAWQAARRQWRNLRADYRKSRRRWRWARVQGWYLIGGWIGIIRYAPAGEQRQNENRRDRAKTVERRSHAVISTVTECQPLWR
jgi:hypothetical protein